MALTKEPKESLCPDLVGEDHVLASPVSPADLTAPSNLLVTFLEHCSIVMQDVKTNTSQNTVKLRCVFTFCSMMGAGFLVILTAYPTYESLK